MAREMPTMEVYVGLTHDFEVAWQAMESDERFSGGNFLFARQAMALLEWACWLCTKDKHGTALLSLAFALNETNRRYFTLMPAGCPISKKPQLPTMGHPDRELIAVLFDLVRNGQAHHYHQRLATLTDGHTFGVSITGVAGEAQFARLASGQRPTRHLAFVRDADGDTWLIMNPGALYFDVKRAIAMCGLLSRVGDYPHWRQQYPFDSGALRSALEQQGHIDDSNVS